MDYFNFLFFQIKENLNLYLTILFFVSLIYILILRKHMYSILDPIVFMILSCVFSTADVMFMYFKGMVNSYYFVHYCITESLMILGIIIFSKINLKNNRDFHKDIKYKNVNQNNEKKIHNLIYIFTSFLFNLTIVFIYYKFGLILLNKATSRLEIYKNMGILYLIIIMAKPTYAYLLVWRCSLKTKKISKIFDLFNLLFFTSFLMLSGSKSDFIIVLFALFYYVMHLNKNQNSKSKQIMKINKTLNFLFIMSIIVAITISNITANKGEKTLDNFMFRLVDYGDIYPLYYLSGLQFDGGNFANGFIIIFSPIIVLFQKLVGIFNIKVVDEFPKLIGLRLSQAVYNTDTIAGGNSRYNIFGLFYFGYIGSMVFSFLSGFMIGFSKDKLYKILPNNTYGSIIYMIVSMAAINNISDPSMGIPFLIENLFYYLFIYMISSMIIGSIPKNKLSKGSTQYEEG